MKLRVGALTMLVGVLIACGGSGAPATPAPNVSGAPQGASQPPVGTQAPIVTPAGNPGSFEGVARGLLPPGSTEISHSSIGGSYQLIASTPMSLAELEAFWRQQIPALGLTETGRFTIEGTLTIALTNPDGGIVVVPGNETGQHLITISLGTSS